MQGTRFYFEPTYTGGAAALTHEEEAESFSPIPEKQLAPPVTEP